MIDIEQEVFKLVRLAAKTENSSVTVYSEYTATPASFPCVMLTEINNSSLQSTQTTESMENHVQVAYQIDIYDKGDNKRKNAKNLAKAIDSALLGVKFSRGMLEKLSDNEDAQLYHIIARYDAVIDIDNRVYTI